MKIAIGPCRCQSRVLHLLCFFLLERATAVLLRGGSASARDSAGRIGSSVESSFLFKEGVELSDANAWVSSQFQTLQQWTSSSDLLPANSSSGGHHLFADSVRAMQRLDAHTSRDCSASYGSDMLQSFRDTINPICEGTKSSVVCHERVPFDDPRYTCELRNAQISMKGSGAGQGTFTVGGTTVSGCENISESAGQTIASFGIVEKRMFGSVSAFGGLRILKTPLNCSTTIQEHALIQIPWDLNNFYEWYGDWVTLWETLAVLEWDPQQTQIFLLVNGNTKSFQRPFDEAWSRAFGANRVHVGTSRELFGNGVCFAHVATVPFGGVSTESFAGGRSDRVRCASPTLMASALFLKALFKPTPVTVPVDKDGNPKKRATLVLRTGSRAFADDGLATDMVRSVLPEDWFLTIYKPEEMATLNEQFALDSSTQLLIGVHGAALTHILFLPPRARVVEVFCQDRGPENRHFSNLQAMSEDGAAGPLGIFHFTNEKDEECGVDSNIVKRAIEAYDQDTAL